MTVNDIYLAAAVSAHWATQPGEEGMHPLDDKDDHRGDPQGKV